LDRNDERPSLNQLLQRRLDNLGPGHRLALQAASVIGYQFDYATWTAVLGDMPAAAAHPGR
jgi:predicted ATPase